MGVQYVNGEYLKDEVPDIKRPQAVMYEPLPDGKMTLIAVEHITFKGPASLEGQLFSFTGAPNRYGLSPFYELHVWAWNENPHGRVRGHESEGDLRARARVTTSFGSSHRLSALAPRHGQLPKPRKFQRQHPDFPTLTTTAFPTIDGQERAKVEMEKPNFKSVRGPFKYGSNHIDWLHIAYHHLHGPLRPTTKEPFVLLLPGEVTRSTARRCSSLLISVNACARHIEIAGAMPP